MGAGPRRMSGRGVRPWGKGGARVFLAIRKLVTLVLPQQGPCKLGPCLGIVDRLHYCLLKLPVHDKVSEVMLLCITYTCVCLLFSGEHSIFWMWERAEVNVRVIAKAAMFKESE